ncbi:MAG: adenylosuccinate lyase [Candidatus Pacebacteria bacterium]|nr:adenylosuccinate lyase [Candidatus Paceibacterota bacterium]
MSHREIEALSPLDGRYADKVASLRPYFSEAGLMKYRAVVEGEYLIALSETAGLGLRKFTDAEKATIRKVCSLTPTDAEAVKAFEATTNHDVKAVEYFLKEMLGKTSIAEEIEWIHFGLTSEDANNLSYALMLRDGVNEVLIPALESIHEKLSGYSKEYARLPMLSRTHGQSASPTTLGKEFAVYAHRLGRQIEMLMNFKILAKINGATGNYNAHVSAFPDIDWVSFSKEFISSLNQNKDGAKLEANLLTTQIESHDTYAELCDTIRRANTILIDFNQDMWRYISDAWIIQKPKAGEVGSSTMPHKVNPIDFENSEGNLGMANAMLMYFATKLPISRLQRDLSDSTVERNFGSAFGYSILAYSSLMKGLSKIAVSEANIREALLSHPEVIAEAIQTVLRREKVEMPYEKLKELTRGRAVTMEEFGKFINALEVSDDVKKELLAFTPENYIGLAEKLAKM